jgi:hypothetical protein
LDGQWQAGWMQWISVSPLGLVRSEARLEYFYGLAQLRGRSWSMRNGKLSQWTWEARYERALD